MTDQISGKIHLKGPFHFVWMRGRDGEISGFVERRQGGMVPGTSGWYRTNDPEEAASVAASRVGVKYERPVVHTIELTTAEAEVALSALRVHERHTFEHAQNGKLAEFLRDKAQRVSDRCASAIAAIHKGMEGRT